MVPGMVGGVQVWVVCDPPPHPVMEARPAVSRHAIESARMERRLRRGKTRSRSPATRMPETGCQGVVLEATGGSQAPRLDP